MSDISTGDRAAGWAHRRAGALLAAVAIAVSVAATAPAAPAATTGTPGTPGTPYVYVANAGSNTVTAYDAVTGTVTATIPVGSQPAGVAVSPDGRAVYVTNVGSGDVSVISTAANTVTATIPVGSGPQGVAISPDGRTAYVANFGSGGVSVISTATDTVTATIPLGPRAFPHGVAVSPDGRTAYVANGGSNAVSVISTATGTVTATIPVTEPGSLAVSPDGRTVYAISFDVAVISTAANAVTATIGVGADPSGVAFSPDGRTAYVTSLGDRGSQIAVIDTATNKITATIYAGFPGAVAVSRDGHTAYVAERGSPGDVLVISTASNTVTGTFPVGNNPDAVATTVLPVAPPPAPTVTAVSPASGPQAGGTRVTITGTGFTRASAVYFGTVPAAKFTANSATRITATAPPATSAGTVDVTVITPHGSSAPSTAGQYTYLPAPKRADVSAALSCPHAITRDHTGACTLTVANAGPDTATRVTDSILLPANLTATSCTPRCALDPSTATWNQHVLASGATAKLTVTARAGAPGRVTILAEAADRTPDPDPYNNVATARVTITRHRH